MVARFAMMAVCCLTLMACRSAPRTEWVSQQRVETSDPGSAAALLWEASEDTLRRLDLRIDRFDRAAGVLTTIPVVSQHWFEFWRKDVHTARDYGEATLNTLRRWIEVTVESGSDPSGVLISVAVYKQRLSRPDRQFNSSGSAYQQFTATEGASESLLLSQSLARERWIDRGRDPAMEYWILRRILKRAMPGVSTQEPEDDVPTSQDS